MSAASAEQAHPLSGNPRWVFNQPDLGFATAYIRKEMEVDDGDAAPMPISTTNTCRETLIYQARHVFRNHLTNIQAIANLSWHEKARALVQEYEASLENPQPAELRIRWGTNYMSDFPEGGRGFPVEKFLKVCDVVLGPVCVLLGPRRQPGDWWKTDVAKSQQQSGPARSSTYIHWAGSDNWFLAHPVTISIATGLYRQCFHLCGAGVADDILKSVPERDIEEALSTCSQKLALRVVKKTRPFIEVPVGTNGSRRHYPFAKGLWRRLIRLQRAIRRYGYEGAMGQTFEEGWHLLREETGWNGVYHFWGDEELTDKHRHLMKMGEPRRRKVADKSAAKAARR